MSWTAFLRPARVAALTAACLTTGACDEVVVEPVPVSSVTVSPATVALDLGASRRLQATATDAAGNALPRPTSWRSGNTAIATVDDEGLVRATGAGSATITATVAGVSGTATIEVSPAPIVSLDPAFATITARQNGLESEAQTIAVSNAGGGVLRGLAATVLYDDAASGWLSTSFESSSAPTTLRITGDPSGLDPGTYSAQVTVSGEMPSAEAVLSVTFQVVSNPPARPDDLTATALSATEIRLDWTDESDNEETFRIERRSSIFVPYTEVGVVAAGQTTFTAAGLQPSTSYAFRIRACNAAGCSDYEGPVVSTTLAAPDIPPPPGGLTATATSTTVVRLEWTDNASNEDEFEVERRLASGGAYAMAGTTDANETTFEDDGLSAGTSYVYRVRACNDDGCSGYSDEVSVTTNAPSPPAAPSGLTAQATSTTDVDLEWDDNASDEASFRIERRPGAGGDFVLAGTVGADVTTFTDSGLSPGTSYVYRVQACNDVGCSGFSNQASVTTQSPTVPAKPSNLQADAISDSEIRLTWRDNSDDETRFDIERRVRPGGSWGVVASVGADVTEFIDSGLAEDTRYEYRVRACNSAGCSSPSNRDDDRTFDD